MIKGKFKKFARRFTSHKFRIYIKQKLFKIKLRAEINRIRQYNDKCVFFISTPNHGNLGDQAIAYSQYQFFNDLGFGQSIIEITAIQYNVHKVTIQKMIKDIDLIIIDGGGNLGTLWIEVEYKMRDIVTRFQKNKVIIFPNTIYYSSKIQDQIELEKSIDIYNKHKNLIMCARDKNSYEFMRKVYNKIDVIYLPDTVLYLNKNNGIIRRKDVLFCLRSDRERTIDEKQVKYIENLLFEKKMKFSYTTMLIDRLVTKDTREDELNKKWDEFSGSKLVITDRLHGMIFAVITGTPCIAFDNISGKVKGVYEWLKHLPYVAFIDEHQDISSCIDELIINENYSYENSEILDAFDELKSKLLD